MDAANSKVSNPMQCQSLICTSTLTKLARTAPWMSPRLSSTASGATACMGAWAREHCAWVHGGMGVRESTGTQCWARMHLDRLQVITPELDVLCRQECTGLYGLICFLWNILAVSHSLLHVHIGLMWVCQCTPPCIQPTPWDRMRQTLQDKPNNKSLISSMCVNF